MTGLGRGKKQYSTFPSFSNTYSLLLCSPTRREKKTTDLVLSSPVELAGAWIFLLLPLLGGKRNCPRLCPDPHLASSAAPKFPKGDFCFCQTGKRWWGNMGKRCPSVEVTGCQGTREQWEPALQDSCSQNPGWVLAWVMAAPPRLQGTPVLWVWTGRLPCRSLDGHWVMGVD